MTVMIDSATSVPVADRVQAPPLLRRGTFVEPVATLLEIADDALTVLDRVVVVVLELRVDPQYSQPHTADAAQHPSIGRFIDGDGGVPALGLEVAQLGGRISTLPAGSSTMVGRQTNCTVA